MGVWAYGGETGSRSQILAHTSIPPYSHTLYFGFRAITWYRSVRKFGDSRVKAS